MIVLVNLRSNPLVLERHETVNVHKLKSQTFKRCTVLLF